VADMHTSGRAIMRIIERDVRMAGFVWRDNKINKIYGDISEPLKIVDSGNKCCDEITVIYDYHNDTTNLTDRVRIRYWVEEFTGSKGTRGRLYKRRDILGRGGKILSKPITGNKDVMADYIEDLQFVNILNNLNIYASIENSRYIRAYDPSTKTEKFRINRRGGTVALTSGTDGLIYSGNNDDRYIRAYDPSTKTEKFKIHRGMGTMALTSDADGLIYAGVNDDRYIRAYDPSTKTEKFSIKRRRGTAALTYGADGLIYAGVGDDRYIRAYDPSTKTQKFAINRGMGTTVLANKNKRTGQESLVNITLILRTKKQYGRTKQYKKKEYFSGNYKIDKTDGYKRDEFSTSVLVRNLSL